LTHLLLGLQERLCGMDLVTALGRTHSISTTFPLSSRGTGGEFVSLRQQTNFPCFKKRLLTFVHINVKVHVAEALPKRGTYEEHD